MSWARLDDRFPDHPKVIAAGREAAWLAVKAICWSSSHLTDGYLPKPVALQLAAADTCGNPKAAATLIRALLRHKLWKTAGGGYRIHDFLEYNPSRAQILAERKRKKESGRLGAEVRWGKPSIASAIAPAIVPAMRPAKALP